MECGDEPSALRAWRSEVPVVVDAASAHRLLALGVPRRAAVAMAAPGPGDVATWQLAVAIGADAVHVLPDDQGQLVDWLATALQPAPCGRLVAVVAGRGGAGASTLAAALALTAADDASTLLLDTDPLGGGHDVLLGIEQADGARWPAFAGASGVLDAGALLLALPVVGDLRVLSCDRETPAALPATAVESVLTAALVSCAVVVADLPRAPGPAAAVLAARAQVALVVVPAEVRAVAAAVAVVRRLRDGCDDVRLVVRHPGPSDLRVDDVARVAEAPVEAVWRWDRRLGRATDSGRFPAAWRRSTVGPVARSLATLLVRGPA